MPATTRTLVQAAVVVVSEKKSIRPLDNVVMAKPDQIAHR